MLLKLLTAPVAIPIAGFGFILDQLVTMAERELYDEDRIREELLLLQVRVDEGEISDEEYADAERDVLARLRAARDYWRQQYEASRLGEEATVSVTVELPEPDNGTEGSS